MKTKDILLVGAGATIIYLLWRRSKKAKDLKGLAGTNGTIGGATTGTNAGAVSSKPEQVYGLNLPTGMDLPNLTAGTGVLTEVAVQQGGVITTPTPIIANAPLLSIEESLSGGNIKPIKSIANTPCEQKWNEYAQTIRPASQEAYEQMKSTFLYQCENPKSYGVSQDVMPITSEESAPIIKNKGELYNAPATLSANGLNSKGRFINARLYRGVM